MTRTEEYQNALNGYMNLDVRINKTLRLIGVSAIKKQIPKKPKFKTTCANCGTHNSVWGRLANPKGHPIVYCWNCGQANELKEGEEDD
jgi:hypothetical protein